MTRLRDAGFFWIGLIGIVTTGAMVGVGVGNLWRLAGYSPLFGYDPTRPYLRDHLLLLMLIALIALADLIGVGVMFAGAVTVVQRLRGRM